MPGLNLSRDEAEFLRAWTRLAIADGRVEPLARDHREELVQIYAKLCKRLQGGVALKFESPYGSRHRRAPTLHRATRRAARSDAHKLAHQVIEANNPVESNREKHRHPGCDVEHRKRQAALVCCRRMIWRLAADPEFLRSRKTMKGYLVAKGWLE